VRGIFVFFLSAFLNYVNHSLITFVFTSTVLFCWSFIIGESNCILISDMMNKWKIYLNKLTNGS